MIYKPGKLTYCTPLKIALLIVLSQNKLASVWRTNILKAYSIGSLVNGVLRKPQIYIRIPRYGTRHITHIKML